MGGQGKLQAYEIPQYFLLARVLRIWVASTSSLVFFFLLHTFLFHTCLILSVCPGDTSTLRIRLYYCTANNAGWGNDDGCYTWLGWSGKEGMEWNEWTGSKAGNVRMVESKSKLWV